ncbi:MAG: RcnB family protein [Sphingomonas sp.]|uniref:RcnB family protein n=1 Tax=Sphingomonas sp. TaxID=28214 RepID=UPI001B2C55AB|nr:RcnB family protein [Sphingomonas sp.]MBO9624720.1 RcnB family protein [Sphingomonas sp.]
MKRLLLLSSALMLIVPDIAMAMQRPERPDRPGSSQQRPPQARPPANRPPAARPPQRPSRPPTARPPQRPPRPPVARPPHRPGQGRPPNFRPIRRPGWSYPRGWSYRRWRAGLILPSLFWSSRYFFSDYGLVGLGAPPPGHMWVRYGPDLLLVRRRDRRIVDVIYDAFF